MKKEREVKSKKLRIILILTSIILVLFVLFFVIFGDSLWGKSYATLTQVKPEQSKTYLASQDPKMKIDDIIQSNIENTVTEQLEKQEIDLEFTTKYQSNPNLPKGTMQVLQDGIDGKQNVIISKKYQKGELIEEKIVGAQVVKASVNKMVEIGTGVGYASIKKIKTGDVAFVTSNILPVREEPNVDAEKVITIEKNTQVKVLQIQGEWSQIQYQIYKGWAKTDCLTANDPNIKQENVQEKENNTYSRQQLINTLGFTMKLNKPSGLSLEQFKQVLSGNKQDKYKVIEENAEYFYYIERQYQINGIFVASVAVHESNWGTSKMAQNKKNLFGYGAYDRNPSDNAYRFNNYSEGIDLLARVFVKYYLNPKGTNIYGGEKASGSHYSTPTVTGVNRDYASDKNWANSVYQWMKYFYNKIP